MVIPRDFTFDRKGPCPICDRAFSVCKHSYLQVEEHLREQAVRSVIYKYDLEPGLQIIDLPKNAKVLCAQAQGETPRLWVQVDTSQPTESRAFLTIGTGQAFVHDEGLVYINTFQLMGGTLVFHVFEIER